MALRRRRVWRISYKDDGFEFKKNRPRRFPFEIGARCSGVSGVARDDVAVVVERVLAETDVLGRRAVLGVHRGGVELDEAVALDGAVRRVGRKPRGAREKPRHERLAAAAQGDVRGSTTNVLCSEREHTHAASRLTNRRGTVKCVATVSSPHDASGMSSLLACAPSHFSRRGRSPRAPVRDTQGVRQRGRERERHAL